MGNIRVESELLVLGLEELYVSSSMRYTLEPTFLEYGPSVTKPSVSSAPSVCTPYVLRYSTLAPSIAQFAVHADELGQSFAFHSLPV